MREFHKREHSNRNTRTDTHMSRSLIKCACEERRPMERHQSGDHNVLLERSFLQSPQCLEGKGKSGMLQGLW